MGLVRNVWNMTLFFRGFLAVSARVAVRVS